jgi:hypothetical protein
VLMGEGARAFLLSAEQPQVEIPVWGGLPAQVDADLQTADGEAVHVEQQVPADQVLVVINQPPASFKVVRVVLQDPLERIAAASVEIEAAPGQARRLLNLTSETPGAWWSMPRPPEGQASYRFRTRIMSRDARVLETDWQSKADSMLVVGDVGVRIERIQVVLVGAADAVGARIALVSSAPPPDVEGRVEAFLDSGQWTVEMALPFRLDAARQYRVEGEVYLADGDVVVLPPGPESAEVLLVRGGPPALPGESDQVV